MTESIGTARLDIVVDTTNMESGIARAKQAQDGLTKSGQQASQQQETNTKRQVASLEKQIATLGKSREEIIRWRIEQQTSGKVASELAAKLEQQVKHLNSGGKAFNQYGVSAKQTAQALRGVPAQITDIAVALQSGQRPLTVLLQQGGQLKDMFGGIVPAVRALAGSLLGLINPFTLSAAAIIGIGAAWHEASSESEEFNKALLLTGNNAGLSVKQLRQMAEEIGATTAASSIGAADTLAKVASTGQFTAEQIGLVAKAAENMKTVSGQAIEDTIAQFVQLKKDPIDAILKLNESQHFLSESTIRQIESFREQGHEADAAALAIKTWADTIDGRAPQAEQNLSGFAQVLQSIKKSAADDTAQIVQMFNAAEAGMQGFVAQHEQLINRLKQISQYVPLFGGTFSTLNPSVASATRPTRDPTFANVVGHTDSATVDSAQERERIKAETEFGNIRERYLSRAKKLEEDIKHIREVGAKAGASQAEIEAQVAAARAAAAEKVSGGGRSRSGAARGLPALKDDSASRQREIEDEARATQAFLDQAAALNGPLAAAERDHLKRVQELQDYAKASPVAAAGLADALAGEAKRYDEATAAIKRQLDPVGQVLAAQALEIQMIGKSNAERAVMNALIDESADLRSKDSQAALAQARANQAEADARQKSIALMDQFRDSAANALTDFVTGAKSAKDALKEFFNTLAQEITQAIAKKWIAQLFGENGQQGGGNYGGIISGILGAFGGGSANGNAFVNGNTVQAFATGGVVSSPTMFGMSGGRFGVMGEAGPEAILPLHRGPDGKLGVRMEAANDSPRVLNSTTVFYMPEETTRKTQAQVAQRQQQALTRATSRNR